MECRRGIRHSLYIHIVTIKVKPLVLLTLKALPFHRFEGLSTLRSLEHESTRLYESNWLFKKDPEHRGSPHKFLQ